jgi:hypothetical protein
MKRLFIIPSTLGHECWQKTNLGLWWSSHTDKLVVASSEVVTMNVISVNLISPHDLPIYLRTQGSPALIPGHHNALASSA